jgi:hypothetical protein
LTENTLHKVRLILNPEKITGITCFLILGVILFRFTVFAFGIPNPVIGAINLGLVLLCFVVILVTEKSIFSLLLLPIVCSMAIFVNSAVHGFEFHRGVIFNSFLAMLFYMYIFNKLNRSYSSRLINILMIYTVFMASAGIIFTLLGINYFFGLRVSTPAEYGYRTTSAFFTNGAYLGFFATFMLAVLFLSKRFSPGNFLIGSLLFSMLILSSNRTALFGIILILFLYLTYSPKIRFPLKIFSLFIFLLFTAVFILLWYNSLYNFKSPDSGRIFLIAKGLKVVKEGFFFGASNLMIDSKTHIAQIHNMYLAIIGEFGIFVLMAYLWFLGWFFKRSGKRGRILMIYLFVYSFFHPGFYIGFSENFFLFLLVTIYMNHYEREQEHKVEIFP